MAWFLFIDESGHDRTASPYEVLAGVAIQDHAVREVIGQLHQEEIRSFGRRYSAGSRELKGRVLLKKRSIVTGGWTSKSIRRISPCLPAPLSMTACGRMTEC